MGCCFLLFFFFFFFLLNDISTFGDYLMLKLSLQKKGNDTVKPKSWRNEGDKIYFSQVYESECVRKNATGVWTHLPWSRKSSTLTTSTSLWQLFQIKIFFFNQLDLLWLFFFFYCFFLFWFVWLVVFCFVFFIGGMSSSAFSFLLSFSVLFFLFCFLLFFFVCLLVCLLCFCFYFILSILLIYLFLFFGLLI